MAPPIQLSPHLPATVAYACLSADRKVQELLHPEERLLIPLNANPRYLVSFAAGRAAAHAALEKLGAERGTPILRGARGMPIWPAGTRGSLTHKQDLAAAVAVWESDFAAVGIDLEIDRPPRHARFEQSICTEQERRWLTGLGDERASMQLAIFSAKESIFKALYPICRRYFGFQSASLEWDGSRFDARLTEELHPLLPCGFRFQVGLRRENDLILTYVLLASADLSLPS